MGREGWGEEKDEENETRGGEEGERRRGLKLRRKTYERGGIRRKEYKVVV